MTFPLVSINHAFDPLAHPNLRGFWEFQNPANIVTDGGVRPGVLGQVIERVDDLSGNARHLTVSDVTAKPSYAQDGSGARYGGFTNDYLRYNAGSVPCATVIGAFYFDGGTANNSRGIVASAGPWDGSAEFDAAMRIAWYSPYDWRRVEGPSHHTHLRHYSDKTAVTTPTLATKHVASSDISLNTSGFDEFTEGILVGDLNVVGDYFMRGRLYGLSVFNAVLPQAERERFVDYWRAQMNL